MKASEYKTTVITGNLHTAGHTDRTVGPYDMRVGVQSQPEILLKWEAKKVYVSLEQPNEDDNFTLIRILFLRSGTKKPSLVAGCTFYNARLYRPEGVIKVRIKKRICNRMAHPLPTCKYTGTCMYNEGGGFAVLTLQAVSLYKQPEPQTPKTILTPGDAEFNVTLADAERTLSRVDGLDRGGIDTSGLRDG